MRNTSYTLFPYLLLRKAGNSFEELDRLNFHKSIKILERQYKLNTTYIALRNTISDQLYRYIPTIDDRDLRSTYIQLRRAIYQGKDIQKFSSYLKHPLPPSLTKLLTSYKVFLSKKERLDSEFSKIYEIEEKKSKGLFRELLKESNLQNGVLLSSDNLFSSLQEYIKKRGSNAKEDVKTAVGFMKYISRLYAKTSPFSTFTYMTSGYLDERVNKNGVSFQVGKNEKTKIYIALNNALYGYFHALLVQHSKIRIYLSLKLNTTMTRDNERYRFLTNNNNRESFQYIVRNSSLDTLYALLQKKRWIYKDFVISAQKSLGGVPVAEVKEYTDQLISYGFIEFDLRVSGLMHNWWKKLGTTLKPLHKDFYEVSLLLHTLDQLHVITKEYQKAPPSEREKLLDKAYELVRVSSFALHVEGGLHVTERASFFSSGNYSKQEEETIDDTFHHEYNTMFRLKKRSVLYEDAYSNQPYSLAPEDAKELKKLGVLLSYMGTFDTCMVKKYGLAYFFKSLYGEEKMSSLLDFYEVYCKRQEEVDLMYMKDPFYLQKIKKSEELLEYFKKRIQHRLGTDIVTFSKKDIKVFPPSHSKISSFNAYVQICTTKNQKGPKLVMNSNGPGFGRMFGRFLNMLDPHLLKAIRENNRKIQKNLLFAEMNDASVFNANTHPYLMPYEITMPGGQLVSKQTKKIQLIDIGVRYNSSTNGLELFHMKDNKEIAVFDLGFQSILGRSPFYQFLSQFFPDTHYHLDPLIQVVNREVRKRFQDSDTIVLPRIIYEDDILLQRKTWIVAKENFPVRDPQEDSASYFKKMHEWRVNLRIPEDVFVVHYESIHGSKEEKKSQNLADDERKPQYISFANPISLLMLEKFALKAKSLKIVEMIPSPKQLVSINGEKVVTEFLAEWYK